MSAVDGNRTESNIPKFDGKEENWFMWKAKFTGYMVANDLISVVEEGESSEIDAGDSSSSKNAKSDKKSKEQIQKNNKLYGALMIALNGEALQIVMYVDRGEAYTIWKLLLGRYERDTVASKLSLRRQLRDVRMDEGGFDVYLAKINQLCLRLKQLKSEVNEEERLFVLLEGLPEKYETLRQSLEVNNIKFEIACQHIRDYQEKREQKAKETTHEHRALNTTTVGKFTCWNCGKEGHSKKNCPSESTGYGSQRNGGTRYGSEKSNSSKGVEFVCHWCGGKDHLERYCLSKKDGVPRSIMSDGDKDKIIERLNVKIARLTSEGYSDEE